MWNNKSRAEAVTRVRQAGSGSDGIRKLVGEWKLVDYDAIMSDALTPEDALEIASATTSRARSAPARPRWVPTVGALLCFGTFLLIGDAVAMPIDRAITARGVAGIVVTLAFCLFVSRVLREWRNGGVVPRSLAEQPVRRWKRVAVGWLPPFVGVTLLGAMPGWLTIASAVIMGAWMWFQLSQPRAES
ncbi:hypothetical protein GCM10027167_04060 [Nocardia heshunensis]